MNITKFNAQSPSKNFSSLLDEIFNRSVSDFLGSEGVFNSPSANVIENKDSFVLDLAAPGLKKEDFKITVDNQKLTISAQKEQSSTEEKQGQWTRREFNFSSFQRSFSLPNTIDSDKIEAQYFNGVLSLHIPKKEEAKDKDPRMIEIR